MQIHTNRITGPIFNPPHQHTHLQHPVLGSVGHAVCLSARDSSIAGDIKSLAEHHVRTTSSSLLPHLYSLLPSSLHPFLSSNSSSSIPSSLPSPLLSPGKAEAHFPLDGHSASTYHGLPHSPPAPPFCIAEQLQGMLSSCVPLPHNRLFVPYQDVLFTQRTFENGEEIRRIYLLHALNHILK